MRDLWTATYYGHLHHASDPNCGSFFDKVRTVYVLADELDQVIDLVKQKHDVAPIWYSIIRVAKEGGGEDGVYRYRVSGRLRVVAQAVAQLVEPLRTGFRYWWVRLIGWFPIQPCFMCSRWYWGGLPMRGWQACYKEFCSKECFDDAARCGLA